MEPDNIKKLNLSAGFTVTARYSKTDEKDKHGRWARLVYYRGNMIAWINRIEIYDTKFYKINDYFPSLMQANPCYSGKDTDFNLIISEVQNRFLTFLDSCNNG